MATTVEVEKLADSRDFLGYRIIGIWRWISWGIRERDTEG